MVRGLEQQGWGPAGGLRRPQSGIPSCFRVGWWLEPLKKVHIYNLESEHKNDITILFLSNFLFAFCSTIIFNSTSDVTKPGGLIYFIFNSVGSTAQWYLLKGPGHNKRIEIKTQIMTAIESNIIFTSFPLGKLFQQVA